MSELIEIKNLSKSFPAREGKEGFVALDHISLTIRAGQSLGLVGRSGCGKTTLGRILLGVIKPDYRQTADRPAYRYNFDENRWIEPAFTDYKLRKEFRRRVQMVYQEAGEALERRYRCFGSKRTKTYAKVDGVSGTLNSR